MTRRLHVLLDEEEYREIRAVARRQQMALSEWVRQALRKARIDTAGTIDAKMRALVDASRHEFPTADIQEMLQEVESGRKANED